MADALPMTPKQVYALFAPDGALRYDAAALGWALSFYTAYALFLAEVLPGWAFFGWGTIAIVRNFNALHEAFHALDRRANALSWGRWVAIVMAPWQLGYRELKKNHREHHAHEGGPRDPDRYLITGSPLWALLQSLTQPEQSVIRTVARRGLDRRLIATLALYASVWGALAWVSTWQQFLLYNAVARFGNTAAWWIFDYLLHQPALYRRLAALPMPRLEVGEWALLFSTSNIRGVRHHYLHHKYPFVPDRRLPELARAISQHAADSPRQDPGERP